MCNSFFYGFLQVYNTCPLEEVVQVDPFERIGHDPHPVTPNTSLILHYTIPVQCDGEYIIMVVARKDSKVLASESFTYIIVTHISIDVTKTETIITSTHDQLQLTTSTTMEIPSTTPAYATSEKVTTALQPSTVHVDGITSKDCYTTKYKEIQSWK